MSAIVRTSTKSMVSAPAVQDSNHTPTPPSCRCRQIIDVSASGRRIPPCPTYLPDRRRPQGVLLRVAARRVQHRAQAEHASGWQPAGEALRPHPHCGAEEGPPRALPTCGTEFLRPALTGGSGSQRRPLAGKAAPDDTTRNAAATSRGRAARAKRRMAAKSTASGPAPKSRRRRPTSGA